MSHPPLRLVIDANIAAKLFIHERGSSRVHRIFTHLADNPPAEFHVPDFFYLECASVLFKAVYRHYLPLEDACADLANLRQLRLRPTSTAALMEDALVLAHDKKISVYDACYAALAKRHSIRLLTADQEILKKIEWAVNLQYFREENDLTV